MKSLNDILMEFVEIELELSQGISDSDMDSVEDTAQQLQSLIDSLGKLVGQDVFYLRQFARKKQTRRAA